MTPVAQEPSDYTPFDEGRVIEFFDEAARTYGEGYAGDSPAAQFFQHRQEIVLGTLDPLGGGRLLDVGCGPGMMVEPCLDRGFNYTGVDISSGMIAECRDRHGDRNDASFLVAMMQSLPFPDANFDVVLCMGALEYLAGSAEVQSIAEMGRVLRGDGLLIVCCLNAASLYWIFDRWYDRLRGTFGGLSRQLRARLRPRSATVPARGPAVPFRTFRDGACRRLLGRSGFGVVDTIFFGRTVLPGPLERRLPGLAGRTSRRLEARARSLRHLAKGFILVARKRSAVTTTPRWDLVGVGVTGGGLAATAAWRRGRTGRAGSARGRAPLLTRG
jgi:ubiquinone/menaquinone biosynthesis C-methylase UbiE